MNTNPPPGKTTPRLIQSVDRAAKLMKVIAADGPIGRRDLARAAGINEGTAWLLLVTLEHHELIDREPDTGRYVIGLGVAELAVHVSHTSLIRRARPVLQRLSARTNEATVLSIARGTETVPIEQVTVPHVVSVQWIGRKIPAHLASAGKVVLAALPADELESYLGGPLETRTDTSISDPGHLRRQIEHTRRTGVAISVGEYDPGANSVSSPAYDNTGRLAGVVTVTGPDYRLPKERLKEVAPLVRTAGEELTKLLCADTP